LGFGSGLTTIVLLVVSLHPLLLVVIKVTLKFVILLTGVYKYEGFCKLLIPIPSPKSHCQEINEPTTGEDKSVK